MSKNNAELRKRIDGAIELADSMKEYVCAAHLSAAVDSITQNPPKRINKLN